MPANPTQFNLLTVFKLSLLIPPNAIIFFLKYFDKILNLIVPKYLLLFFVLFKGDKKRYSTFCLFFIFISLKLCADPRTVMNFVLLMNAQLLKDGI